MSILPGSQFGSDMKAPVQKALPQTPVESAGLLLCGEPVHVAGLSAEHVITHQVSPCSWSNININKMRSVGYS